MTRSLAVAVLGGADLDDAVLGLGEGGRQLPSGLATILQQRHPALAEIDVRRVDPLDVWAWADDLDRLRDEIGGADVALRSIQPDLHGERLGPALASEFSEAMAAIIAACKDEDVRLIVLNGSTYAPDDTVSCYQRDPETPALAIHRLDLELIELSMLDGISVVDVDRIVAERGGGAHVSDWLSYSCQVCEAIRDELVDVFEDYGFCDDRPVLAQRGRRAG